MGYTKITQIKNLLEEIFKQRPEEEYFIGDFIFKRDAVPVDYTPEGIVQFEASHIEEYSFKIIRRKKQNVVSKSGE